MYKIAAEKSFFSTLIVISLAGLFVLVLRQRKRDLLTKIAAALNGKYNDVCITVNRNDTMAKLFFFDSGGVKYGPHYPPYVLIILELNQPIKKEEFIGEQIKENFLNHESKKGIIGDLSLCEFERIDIKEKSIEIKISPFVANEASIQALSKTTNEILSFAQRLENPN
jgi:hypothetical protein